MKCDLKKSRLEISPENTLEEVYIEAILHLYEEGDSIKLVRAEGGKLVTVAEKLGVK